MQVRIVVVVCCALGVTLAYPYGAPVGSCLAMFPTGHAVDQQTSAPPFQIQVSQATYNPNDVINVTLHTLASDLYKYWEGVLLQARRVAGNMDEPIGTWTIMANDTNDLKTLNCSGINNSAVTHNVEKHYVTKVVQWTAPPQAQGHVKFRATFVKNKVTFWVNVMSATVQDPTAEPITDNGKNGASSTRVIYGDVFVLATLCTLLKRML
ncbi:putative defense protein Hdd11-like [Lingula anatina]|uniref:Defense protein Hdd11-like n=1 Tax=Lingula anatina TaxID=7574 RepID=A0A1S3HKG6_LINAN|nr:putative defense protein Hdd11-like [Lingula anatina]|eukprot:XP_013385489.1 putative defense protein Hdd11-like [Lingula anatina]